MGFGKKLQEKMDIKGMKQTDLANAVGIPKSTLNSMISRDNTRVDIDVFLKICTVLGCSPEEFTEDINAAREEVTEPLRSDEKHLLKLYNSMNDEGKEKAIERIEEMTCVKRFIQNTDTLSEEKEIFRAANSSLNNKSEITKQTKDEQEHFDKSKRKTLANTNI